MLHVAYAHAKVNLFLNIVGRRPNGYHELQSYFVKLGLKDEVHARPSSKVSCSVEGGTITNSNIVLKAIHHFNKVCNSSNGIDVYIKKNIPIAAGLGGGSSNAAAVLKLLPKLWGIQEISEEQLEDIALNVGADVPFFLKDRNSFVEGIGETLIPVKLGRSFFIILINPKISILTKNVFKGIVHRQFSKKIEFTPESIIKEIFYGKNDLEEYVKEKHSVIKKLIEKIGQQNNCIVNRMSGSGSTCFGIFDKRKDAINAVSSLSKLYPDFWIHHEKVTI